MGHISRRSIRRGHTVVEGQEGVEGALVEGQEGVEGAIIEWVKKV